MVVLVLLMVVLVLMMVVLVLMMVVLVLGKVFVLRMRLILSFYRRRYATPGDVA